VDARPVVRGAGHLRGGRDSALVRVDASDATAGRAREVARGTARPAGDFERVTGGGQLERGDERVVLVDRRPTVLTDVDAEGLLADRIEDLGREVALRAVEEVDSFRHRRSAEEGTVPETTTAHSPARWRTRRVLSSLAAPEAVRSPLAQGRKS